jgi:hypothetical protein
LARIDAVISGTDWHGLDGSGYIANRIEAPVRRREIGGLTDDRAANFFHDLAKSIEIGRCVIPGYALGFIGRATRVAETAAGNHGHVTAASSSDWRQQKTDLVTNTACRMLVYDRPIQPFL